MRCFLATCLAVTLCGVFGSDVYALSNEGVCSLAPETGPCRGSFVRFYYNPERRQCQTFVFGGCSGNANNFRSLEECQEACAAIQNYDSHEDVCSLKAETGPCRARMPRFHFNKQTGQCEQFIFGGCGGNENNFRTIEECQNKCQMNNEKKVEICQQPIHPGMCVGYFPRFAFNKMTGKCERFVYGGCQANDNNFLTIEECQSTCVTEQVTQIETHKEEEQDACHQPIKSGMCLAYIPRFAFNEKTGKCERFIYGGCGANSNNFQTIQECKATCEKVPEDCPQIESCPDGYVCKTVPMQGKPHCSLCSCVSEQENYIENHQEEEQDVCQQPIKPGMCLAYIPRFAFNKQTGKCERFVYGGCGANGNNFETVEECQASCEMRKLENNVCPIREPCPRGFVCFLKPLQDKPQCKVCKCVRRDEGRYVNEVEKEQDVCHQPIKPGMCLAYFPRFAFNKETGKCERFVYGGCGANSNNFETVEECQATCEKNTLNECPLVEPCGPGYTCHMEPMERRPQCSVCNCVPEEQSVQEDDACDLPIHPGLCQAYFPRFAFNKQTGKCERFIYGGCQANANNFETMEQCQNKCEGRRLNNVCPIREPCSKGFVCILKSLQDKPQCKVCKCVRRDETSYVNEDEREQDVCQQPIKSGMCLAYIPRFAFNKETGKCERFIYGGCGANGNNFETVEECQATCEKNTLSECPLVEPCGPGYTCHMEPMEGRPQCSVCNCVPEEQSVQEDDACDQPIYPGLCRAYFPRFAFNKKTGKCERFIYGGCQANANNFETMEQCQNKCEAKATNVCNLPAETGRCLAYIPRFHFNGATGQCEQFIYGGCGGNGNNFESLQKCQSMCQNH